MQISIIAAMAENNVIGRENQLPWHLPNDLRHFKSLTMGKPVLMGRKTFDSIGRALPMRRNCVISRNPQLIVPDCEVYPSFTQALSALVNEPEVMVIGGQSLYEQALPMAHRLYLTLINAQLQGDVFFPQWCPQEWETLSQSYHKKDDHHLYNYTFITMRRLKNSE